MRAPAPPIIQSFAPFARLLAAFRYFTRSKSPARAPTQRAASMGACLIVSLIAFFIPASLFAAFGLTSSGGFYTVDTGAGLVFKVNQTSGDITSLVFNGVEYQYS